MKYDLRSMNKSKNNIKAVVFDVGGVLIEKPWNNMMNYFAKTLHVNTRNFESILNEVYRDYEINHISEEAVWKHITSRYALKQKPKTGLWLKGVSSVFRDNKNIVSLTQTLKKSGYQLAILSNTEQPTAFYLEKRFSHFDALIFSCRIGIAKPHKGIYEYTLTKLGRFPHEVVFIDDKKENIEAAKTVGIHTIQYTSHEAFLKEFSHYVNLR